MAPSRAVFLDRDGVINRAFVRDGKPYPPDSLAEFEFLPGVKEAVAVLKNRGLVIIVVTNQPDVGAGRQRREVVEALHDLMQRELPIDAVKVCYHVEADGCRCRKPRPGMLVEAAAEHDIALSASFVVGDRWRDIEAGQAVGCMGFFIDYGYQEKQPEQPFVRVESLLDAAMRIVNELSPQP
jgi:D-glycero-D-manno-heptose 1,7-bisphosphate phosphatase